MNKSDASFSPIVRAFIISVLKNIYANKVVLEKEEKIDADLIPRVSDRVLQSKILGEKIQPSLMKPIQTGGRLNVKKRFPMPARTMPAPRDYRIAEKYNVKIDSLLKIVLSKDEIRNFLGKIAVDARVPLIEGVFHVAVDDFIINAVVSEDIGSRFVLRKMPVHR